MKLFQIAFPIVFLCVYANTEKILFFHGVASYSHRVQTWPVAEALSKRGHQVSYISPFYSKEPNPNISELVPRQMANYVDSYNSEFDIKIRVRNAVEQMHTVEFDFAVGTCKNLLESPEFKEWLEKNEKFDLFIIDNCFAECGLGLAKRMGAKSILFNTVVTIPYEYDKIGFLPESSAIPELEVYSHEAPMSFFQRVSNTFVTFTWDYKYYLYSQKMDELLKDNLAPGLPHVGDLLRNISLVMYTGDVITDYARSFPPLFVNVAGTHCKESTEALPKELEQFISSTKPGMKNDGFVYISLGSFILPSNLPKRIKQVFFDVIRAYPNVKFLWKWNTEFPVDMPEDIPDNLMLRKWFPQIDVLGYPKIRGFITQSGRPSILEALYLGVPMITFPILGDQDTNANRLNEVGASIKLEIGRVTFDELRDAVGRVVYDPRIKKRMEKFQKIFRDRPMSPVKTAVWWVDYVLRHEDTSHLRSPGHNQYWFVRRQVDVWAFLTILTLIGTIITVKLVKRIVRNIFRRKSTEKLKRN